MKCQRKDEQHTAESDHGDHATTYARARPPVKVAWSARRRNLAAA